MQLLSKYNRFWFGQCDARTYAFLRITFALAALTNLVDLWPRRFDLFSDAGMVLQPPEFYGHLSNGIFAFARDAASVNAVCIAAALAIFALMIGFLTPLSMLFVFVWSFSYAYRINPALEGLDIIFRSVGFILLFAPLGRVWSVDRFLLWKIRGKETPETAAVFALRLLRWQFTLIYLTNAVPKLFDPFWLHGEFLSYFLLSMYSRVAHPVVSAYHALLQFASWGALFAELTIPFFLYFRRTRLLGLLLGLMLHVGIALTSHLWVFSVVMLSMYPMFFDWREDSNAEGSRGPVRR